MKLLSIACTGCSCPCHAALQLSKCPSAAVCTATGHTQLYTGFTFLSTVKSTKFSRPGYPGVLNLVPLGTKFSTPESRKNSKAGYILYEERLRGTAQKGCFCVRNGSVTPREEGFTKQTQVMLLGGWCAEDVA